jgi:hypothetical protein
MTETSNNHPLLTGCAHHPNISSLNSPHRSIDSVNRQYLPTSTVLAIVVADRVRQGRLSRRSGNLHHIVTLLQRPRFVHQITDRFVLPSFPTSMRFIPFVCRYMVPLRCLTLAARMRSRRFAGVCSVWHSCRNSVIFRFKRPTSCAGVS